VGQARRRPSPLPTAEVAPGVQLTDLPGWGELVDRLLSKLERGIGTVRSG